VTRPALVPELDVASVPASLRFYVEVLGFTIAYERPEEGFAYLERSAPTAAHVMLQQADGPGRRFRTAPLHPPHGRGVNFQLEVVDVDAVHERITALGYELVVPLEDRWYRTGGTETGQRQLVVADPDGYLWRPVASIGRRAGVPADQDVVGGDGSDQT
jgi:catechol 2,3-dioxygenase-like lactoylglutathione lyase family enzyme